jgi:hypothetical protein
LCCFHTLPSFRIIPPPSRRGLGGHRVDQGEGGVGVGPSGDGPGSKDFVASPLIPAPTAATSRERSVYGAKDVGGARPSGIVELQTALSVRPATRAPPPQFRGINGQGRKAAWRR